LKKNIQLPPPGTYKEELGYVPGTGCEHAAQKKFETSLSYMYRFKLFLMDQIEKQIEEDWVLFLESDAESVNPSYFQQQIYCIIEKCGNWVDVVFLDFRNIGAGYFQPIIGYVGTNGLLLRTKSFPKIIKEIYFNPKICPERFGMNVDINLGDGCYTNRLVCNRFPLLTEHDFPSTLNYGRDAELGRQSTTLVEFWVVIVFIFILWRFSIYKLNKCEIKG